MPTSAKLPAKTAKPPVKRLDKKQSPSAQPSLRFYYSESLRTKTLGVLATLEGAKDCAKYRSALTDIIEELTDSGMDYYFLRPLKLAGAGFLTEQSANLGMSATTGMLASVIRNIVGGMDGPQLLVLCGHIRQLMK